MLVVNIITDGCEMDLEFKSRDLAKEAEHELRVWTMEQGLIVTIKRWFNSVMIVFTTVTEVWLLIERYNLMDRVDY